MAEDINIGKILKNAIEYNEELINSNHILSNITVREVLALSDETNTLKIFTSSSDIFNLNNSTWQQISTNDEDGFSIFVSTINETVKLLIDETVVEII